MNNYIANPELLNAKLNGGSDIITLGMSCEAFCQRTRTNSSTGTYTSSGR